MQIDKQTMSIMRKASEEINRGVNVDQAVWTAIRKGETRDPALLEKYATEVMDIYRAGKSGDASVQKLASDLGLINVSSFQKLSNSIQAVAEFLATTSISMPSGGGTGPVE
jgi:hypothetical protein